MTPHPLCEQVRDVAQTLRTDLEQAARGAAACSPEQLAARVADGLQRCLDQLAATNCWGEENRLPAGVLWQVAGDLLQRGALQHHARAKPRGYAGDFELLRKIGLLWVGDEPLGRAMDQFFQSQAAPQAVRNRNRFVAERLIETLREGKALSSSFHAVSIGCGPAIDMELAAQVLDLPLRGRLRLTLLDLDPLALEHATDRLGRLLRADQIRACRENLSRLHRLPRIQELLSDAEFISCPGFFDYLHDDAAASLLNCLWRHLQSPGELVIFNFSPANASRAYMEWIGNWYLIHRDASDLQRLARRALPDAREVVIDSDPSGASLSLRAAR